MKKRKANCCFLCEKEHLDCDGQRPCNHCIEKNRPRMCIGQELSKPHQTKPMFQNSKTVERPEPNNIPSNLTGDQILAGNPFNSDSTQQTNINAFFLSELMKVKAEQRKTNEELTILRQQNESLENKLVSTQRILKQVITSPRILPGDTTTKNQVIIPTTINTPVRELSDIEKLAKDKNPAVLFDLSKKTARVVTANNLFCSMLGYEMNEVIGMSWQKFLHPNFVARTLNILNQKPLTGVIKFEQIYKHKKGGIFRTMDSHQIKENVSDLVSIELSSTQNSTQPIKAPVFEPAATRFVQKSLITPTPVELDKQLGNIPIISPASSPLVTEPETPEYSIGSPVVQEQNSPIQESSTSPKNSVAQQPKYVSLQDLNMSPQHLNNFTENFHIQNYDPNFNNPNFTDPNINSNINPNINQNLNPNINQNINQNINPNINQNLNPNINQNINQNIDQNIKENININPNIDPNINPNINQDLTISQNNNDNNNFTNQEGELLLPLENLGLLSAEDTPDFGQLFGLEDPPLLFGLDDETSIMDFLSNSTD